MSVGSKSSSGSQQQTSESFVWDQQIPYLTNLWDQASAAAGPTGVGEALTGVNNFMQPILQNTATSMGALTDPSGQIAAQSASLQSGLGQLFREQINPAIQTNSIAAGGFGGGRQGVAEGVATGQLANAYTQGLGDIVARANQTAIGAGALMPNLGAAQQALAQAPYSAPLDQLAMLAQIIGNPTILQKSQGTQTQSSRGWEVGLPIAPIAL